MVAKKEKKRGLARGLDALLGDSKIDLTLPQNQEGLIEMSIAQLQTGQYQPRVEMNEESLKSLAETIRQKGVLQPIIIRKIGEKDGKDFYEIISGERRVRASQLLGKETIPALIKDVDDATAAQIGLIENLQREDLNPLEEAEGIQRLITDFQYTHEEVANYLGRVGKERSRSSISNLLRLQKLSSSVKQMLIAKNIEMGHARALLAIEDPSLQTRLAQEVISKELNVRQTEKLVHQTLTQKPGERPKIGKTGDILQLERDLSDALATTVHVEVTKKGRGKLVIEFANNEVFDGILARLKLTR